MHARALAGSHACRHARIDLVILSVVDSCHIQDNLILTEVTSIEFNICNVEKIFLSKADLAMITIYM